MARIDLAGLSPEERRQLLEQLQRDDKQQREDRKEAYETLRNSFMNDVFAKVELIESEVVGFKKWLDGVVQEGDVGVWHDAVWRPDELHDCSWRHEA